MSSSRIAHDLLVRNVPLSRSRSRSRRKSVRLRSIHDLRYGGNRPAPTARLMDGGFAGMGGQR